MGTDTSNKVVSKTKFVAPITCKLNNGVHRTYSKQVTRMHISRNGTATRPHPAGAGRRRKTGIRRPSAVALAR